MKTQIFRFFFELSLIWPALALIDLCAKSALWARFVDVKGDIPVFS